MGILGMEQKISYFIQGSLQEAPNIMIVDNDPICHLIAEKITKQSGCVGQIQQAWDGNEALQQLTNALSLKLQLPDIILLDINMPTLDGFEFLAAFQQLRRQMKKAPNVVVLSSSILPSDRHKARTLGADHVVEKPLTSSLFKDIVRICMGKADVTTSAGRSA